MHKISSNNDSMLKILFLLLDKYVVDSENKGLFWVKYT